MCVWGGGGGGGIIAPVSLHSVFGSDIIVLFQVLILPTISITDLLKNLGDFTVTSRGK